MRRLPLASVAPLAAVREAGLPDLASKHERAVRGGLAGVADDAGAPPPVEFAPGPSIDVVRLAVEAVERAARDAHIVVDPEIKGGSAVIRGPRMTVCAVQGRVGGGEALDDVGCDTPDLAREALEAAVVCARTHPLRGRPGGRPWRRGEGGWERGRPHRGVRLPIDECLSPRLAPWLGETGEHDAVHPLHVGRRGPSDHRVLAWCLEEDRVIVAQDGRDGPGLVAGTAPHPGPLVLPSPTRGAGWRLLRWGSGTSPPWASRRARW